MKCELMHRKISAAEIEIDSDSGSITRTLKVSAPEHLPIGTADQKGSLSRKGLNQWWTDRSIPASRSGLRDALDLMGIPGVVPFLDRMIVLDYLIANEDRHYNNFGALRNAETLEWIGMAPIYDSGSSLGYNKVARRIASGEDIVCKPFKRHHEEQLKLVWNLAWIDFESLSDVRELIAGVLSSEPAAETIDEGRIEAVTASVEGRIRRLRESGAGHPGDRSSLDDDRTDNTAAVYH